MPSFRIDSIGPLAWAVIATLVLMSTVSVAVMLERAWTYRRARRRAVSEWAHVLGLVRRGALADVAKPAAVPSPLTQVLVAATQDWMGTQRVGSDLDSSLASADRAARLASILVLAELRRGLPVLATIGSTAPFVGLFGTTLGIMNAFAAIATTGSGGMGVIAAGIAEALFTTALGLVVAVPAVWAYNVLLARVERFEVELERGRHLVLGALAASSAA